MRTTVRTTLRRAAGLTAAAAVTWLPVVGPPPPALAVAADGPECTAAETGATPPVTGTNDVTDALHVDRAQELVGRPGAGVTVVVVDSGVAPGLADSAPWSGFHRVGEVISPHGSVVAGLVAGADQGTPGGAGHVPIGVAPDARVVSLRVHDQEYDAGADEAAAPSSAGVAAALGWVARERRALGARVVVVVATVVGRSSGLVAALERLDRAGVLVVAPTGDRPSSRDSRSPLARYAPVAEEDAGALPPPRDARAEAWPAAHDSVLGVGVAGATGDPVPSAVPNSAVDLAAPTAGAVSRGLTGRPCVLTFDSTEYAAGVVGGVAALVWSGRPGLTADALADRLVRTAAGPAGADPASPLVGAGVVQPVDALQRPDDARPTDPGAEVVPRATAPADPVDALAGTRRRAVWWGLAGGAALLVAVLLRPVVRRR